MMLLYIFLAGLVVAAVLLILRTSHILYAALGLLGVLLGMAAIYFLQGAAFVAVAHIIVYGGGVVVLILFSALMLPLSTRPIANTKCPSRWLFRVFVAGLLAGCLWPLVRFAVYTLQQQGAVAYALQADAVTALGLQLLGPYALAFEWMGLNLLIALVGAAYLMKK